MVFSPFTDRTRAVCERLPGYPDALVPCLHFDPEQWLTTISHRPFELESTIPSPSFVVQTLLNSTESTTNVISERDWIRRTCCELFHCQLYGMFLSNQLIKLIELNVRPSVGDTKGSICSYKDNNSSTRETPFIALQKRDWSRNLLNRYRGMEAIYKLDWDLLIEWVTSIRLRLDSASDWIVQYTLSTPTSEAYPLHWVTQKWEQLVTSAQGKTVGQHLSVLNELEQIYTEICTDRCIRLQNTHIRLLPWVSGQQQCAGNGLLLDRLMSNESHRWAQYEDFEANLIRLIRKERVQINEFIQTSASRETVESALQHLHNWFGDHLSQVREYFTTLDRPNLHCLLVLCQIWLESLIVRFRWLSVSETNIRTYRSLLNGQSNATDHIVFGGTTTLSANRWGTWKQTLRDLSLSLTSLANKWQEMSDNLDRLRSEAEQWDQQCTEWSSVGQEEFTTCDSAWIWAEVQLERIKVSFYVQTV